VKRWFGRRCVRRTRISKPAQLPAVWTKTARGRRFRSMLPPVSTGPRSRAPSPSVMRQGAADGQL